MPENYILRMLQDRWRTPPNRSFSRLYLLQISKSRFAVKHVLRGSGSDSDNWIEDSTVEVGKILGEKVGDNGNHKYLTRKGSGYDKGRSIADALSVKLYGKADVFLVEFL
jgi:hypothetical protein